jgi:hypothetical protein
VALAFTAPPVWAVTVQVAVLPLKVQFVPDPDANAYPGTFDSVIVYVPDCRPRNVVELCPGWMHCCTL